MSVAAAVRALVEKHGAEFSAHFLSRDFHQSQRGHTYHARFGAVVQHFFFEFFDDGDFVRFVRHIDKVHYDYAADIP